MKSERVGQTRTRKVREDKKREVRPIVDLELYDFINRISYVTSRPLKDIGEMIIIRALKSKKVIEHMSKQFRYDYMWENRTLFRGQPEREPYRHPTGEDKKRLPSFRFRNEYYDRIHELSYALDTSAAQAAAFLLVTAIDETEVVNQYIAYYVEEELLDPKRLKQLKEIIRFMNRHVEERFTLVQLLDYFKEELFQAGSNFKASFIEWIDRHSD